MASLNELSPWLLSVLMAFIVVLLKALISLFSQTDPLRFFRFYCQRLSNKVNKPSNNAKQQTVAGLVAFLITLFPIIAVLWLFETFVAVPWLWHGFLLYLAIDGLSLFITNKAVAKTLVAKQHYQAKQLLQPLLLRQTDKLSALGLTKASIEMQVLRIGQQLLTVLFFFFLAGPLAAVAFRLLLEMHYSWNTKSRQFIAFGLRIHQLVNILQWLPMRLFGITLLFSTLGQGFILNWRLSRSYFFKLNNDFVMLIFALSLGCKLGGVAMYDSEKLRKRAFNEQGKQPEVSDIIHASSRIKYSIAFLSFSVILVTVAQLSLSQ